ncbi:Uncharacterised protein [Mycobacteroides abscessus subsp. massiliense]|nr:Uncharacterised protein [Mycobacteroides abscessus subsp. massiliense]
MVDNLKAEARQRHAVTVDDLLHELEQARAAALTAPTPQSSAAVSATMGKAKMLGLLVDKAEIKAEAKISQVKQEERKCPLTEEERKQVSNAFFNKSYSEITLADITAFGHFSNLKTNRSISNAIFHFYPNPNHSKSSPNGNHPLRAGKPHYGRAVLRRRIYRQYGRNH